MICSTTTLNAFFESVYTPHRLLAASPATLEDYAGTISVFTRFAGRPVPLAEVDDTTVASYLAWLLANKRTRATANKHLRNLRALLRYAAETADQPPPAFRTKPIPEYKTDPAAWTPAQYNAILTHAEQIPGFVGPVPAALWWPAILLTVTNTGLRISATMAIETADWDSTAQVIRVKAPTQKQRADQWFSLLPETSEALRQLDPRGRNLQTLFADWPHDRHKRQWSTLNDHLAELLKAAGLPHSRRDKWHKFRRTMATLIVANGGTVEQAQTLLGHSSPTITQRYLDQTQIRPPSAAELLKHLRTLPSHN